MASSEGRLVECTSCNAKNRVPPYSFKRRPQCGSCRNPLPEQVLISGARRLYRARYLLGVVAGLGLLIIWPPVLPSINLGYLADLIKSSPTQAPKDICAGFPQPAEGLLGRYTRRSDVAPLSFRTADGANYFVKMSDASTGRPMLTFFLLGGSTFETQVPRGTFVLRYATGTTWCGESELFGSSTQTSEASHTFEFDDGRGYTIELIAQRDGNLPTRRISRETF